MCLWVWYRKGKSYNLFHFQLARVENNFIDSILRIRESYQEMNEQDLNDLNLNGEDHLAKL